MPGSCSSGFRSRPSGAAGQQAVERVGREQHEQQEADADQPHHREHARDHGLRQVRAEQRHRQRPQGEHQQPQQQRAFVAAPRGGEPVVQRQRRVGVLRDVQHREVVVRERRTPAPRRRSRPAGTAPAPPGAPAPSSGRWPRAAPASGSVPCTSATASARRQRELAELGNHFLSPPITDSAILPLVCAGALERLAGLRRHVVLVVLGQHLARVEHAVGAHLALRDHALALLEQVGQDAAVGHGHGLRGVGDDEVHVGAVALDAAFLHQAADAERAVQRRLVRGHLRRRIEEHQVALERVEHQRGGHADGGDDAADQRQPLVAGLHWAFLLRTRLERVRGGDGAQGSRSMRQLSVAPTSAVASARRASPPGTQRTRPRRRAP